MDAEGWGADDSWHAASPPVQTFPPARQNPGGSEKKPAKLTRDRPATLVGPVGAEQKVNPDELCVSWVEGLDAFLELESKWRALLRHVRTGNPFLGWEWVSEWAQAFWGDQVVTLVVHSGPHAAAIVPFFCGPSLPLPAPGARHLQLFGPRRHRNLLEMGTVLMDPAHAVAAIRLTLESIMRRGDWDWVEFAACGDDLHAWEQALATADLKVKAVVEQVTDIPMMRLDESWPQLRTRLRRNVKQSIRHAYNAPRRDGIAYSYREHRSVDGLDEIIDNFIRLHRLRAREMPGKTPHGDHFGHPAAELFLRRVTHRLAAAGMLNISVLDIDQQCVAVRINFEVDDTLYFYYSGFDPQWWRYSVMTLIVTEAVKSAIERGLRMVNFSPGNDQAKSRWDVELVPLHRFFVVNDGRLSRTRFAIYRLLRQLSKRSELSRRVFRPRLIEHHEARGTKHPRNRG
jgi:CelD/BcsL family acetyltransferase involved in cellulose biosynthesis